MDNEPNSPKQDSADLKPSPVIEYGDIKIPYTIVKKELVPNFSGFLGYDAQQGFYISDEVPEAFRVPQLIHEYIEFIILQKEPGSCLEALKQELDFVPSEIRKDYLQYRRDFFTRLISYYQNRPDKESFKAEIQASYEFLKTLLDS